MEPAEVRRRIVEYLKATGGASVYQIAKALGISYGAAQWHLYVLERDGVVFTVSHGKKRIAVLRDSLDAYLHSLKMADFFKELWAYLRSRGVSSETPFMEVIDMLNEDRRDIALALLSIAKNLYQMKKASSL
ncbi:P. aerophilum family 453, possible regulatory protein [Pyrobaculum aerophilum str. IM2]|uniref:P. aerophilum family 453, possible regulatory protein n=1 Tax=Pyrobaculum aerophilum (strain ATCC 51768 / DSM 7523 / JCM 9630 / CIP 104966 / NBRC 100827 / IM2) TaxID=178306 RepID=Q8ZWC9_PYRAE|nr:MULTISPECIES: winged helix-turn-helix domain-containing protein [Pyrobaculum]AAL63773.1 P. aerophilum family 453, possible regulatory protein [Pyrobaculum aerophilum str. IM2]